MHIKKVIFIGHDNFGSREIFTKMVKDHPEIKFLLIVTTGLYYKKKFIPSIIKLLKESSFLFSFNRFLELLKYKIKNDTLVKRAKNWGIKVFFTDDINGSDAHKVIRGFEPDVIYSSFTMHILKSSTIKLSKIATIGCHPSILPHYRGLEVFFWALANSETKSGCSVFYVTEKIDTGKVILQEEFLIDEDETVKSIYEKLTRICAKLMSLSLDKLICKEEFIEYPSEGKGSYFPMPTNEAYKKFKITGRKWK
jgi:folate-dependent phosphoribosylglycinamide formyltransferase PurN